MTDVSTTLRAAREGAGLTLEEISARTKIKVALLQAIEHGAFEQLPGEFFARAFIRTYARELHLPPDQIVAAYDARYAPVAALSGPVTDSVPVAPRLDSQLPRPPRRPLTLPSPRSAWPTVVLAAAVLAIIFVMQRPAQESPKTPAAVGTSGVAGAAQAQPPAPAPAVTPEKLTIDIRPTRIMWVAGIADGKRVIYRLVEAGEHLRIDAHDDLWFRVGDAGAFVYSINGSPEKPLGASGEVREFRITHDNYRTFGR